ASVRASPASDVPVILVYSGLLDVEERDRCKQLGVKRTVLKPFRRAALHEALRDCRGEVQEASGPISEEPAEGRPTGLRILLVEDNKVNQRLISRLLEKMGHVVTIAGNGEIALRITAQ